MVSRLEILIHMLHTSGLSPEEKVELGNLLEINTFDTSKVKQASASLNLIPKLEKEKSWNRLKKTIEHKSRKNITHGFLLQLRNWQVAASITLVFILACIWFITATKPQVYNTPLAEHKSVQLNDGSIVLLDAGSNLKVLSTLFVKSRQLELKGRGFFKVTKGTPFIVHTSKGNVEVLGTQFTVDQFENTFRVHCISGSVKVSDNYGNIEVLKKGDIINLINNKLSKSTLISKVPSWVSGRYTFDNAPLEDVVLELQRQFGKNINYIGPKGKFYTGEFMVGDLSKALDMVCLPLGLHYELKEEQVTIKP